MKNKRLIIVITTLLVITGVASWYIYRDLNSGKPTTVVGSKEVSQPDQEAVAKNSANIVTEPSISENIKAKMPDLDKEIVVNNKNLLEEEKSRTIKNIREIIAVLKEDYDRREEWLNLGILRKNLGDYEGAKEAWIFVTLIRPNDPVAFHNLGDLYAQYLIDFSKAEKYYLMAIANDSSQDAFFYVKLHEFYRYFVKKPDLALDILEKGAKASGDDSLKKLFEQYHETLRD